MSDIVPASSSSWVQDGLPIERVEARLTGTVGVVDKDAPMVALDREGVAVVRYHVYEISGKTNEKTSETFRKSVMKVTECRVVHDPFRAERLLVDLGFDVEPIDTTAVTQPQLGGVDAETGEITGPGQSEDIDEGLL